MFPHAFRPSTADKIGTVRPYRSALGAEDIRKTAMRSVCPEPSTYDHTYAAIMSRSERKSLLIIAKVRTYLMIKTGACLYA